MNLKYRNLTKINPNEKVCSEELNAELKLS